MDVNYPLYLRDFPDREVEALWKILLDAKRQKLLTVAELERRLGQPLHSIFNPAPLPGETGEDAAPKRPRAPISHRKWAFLYNFVMAEMWDQCRAEIENLDRQLKGRVGGRGVAAVAQRLKDLKALDHDIITLEDMGRKSGRYDADMHLFNAEHMYLDRRAAEVDPRFMDDTFVCFRYQTSGRPPSGKQPPVVIAVIQLSYHTSDPETRRPVFKSLVVRGPHHRETAGLVYQLAGTLHMFGFLNENHGAELYSLKPVDAEHTVLHGIMTTLSNEGIPHAKTCFMVKFNALLGLRKMKPAPLFSARGQTSSEARKALIEKLHTFYIQSDNTDRASHGGQSGIVTLDDGENIPLNRYLTRQLITPVDDGSADRQYQGSSG